ncbi:hypothetical protein [Candidatus Methylomicrobium oryzae]|uniref:hypothetical protein n=1 Tax=Candidatus Methylomicrobium oryzae TaxID=2802053 RepID=UPI0019246401|nr:hypothetical protein [Methylomicrobium sp. RS1]
MSSPVHHPDAAARQELENRCASGEALIFSTGIGLTGPARLPVRFFMRCSSIKHRMNCHYLLAKKAWVNFKSNSVTAF